MYSESFFLYCCQENLPYAVSGIAVKVTDEGWEKLNRSVSLGTRQQSAQILFDLIALYRACRHKAPIGNEIN